MILEATILLKSLGLPRQPSAYCTARSPQVPRTEERPSRTSRLGKASTAPGVPVNQGLGCLEWGDSWIGPGLRGRGEAGGAALRDLADACLPLLTQSRGFSRKSQTFLPKVFFRKMSSSGAKDKPELQFPFLQDEETVATLQECKTLFILRGLPGSGKSTLARFIVDRYRDGTKMVSADSYKITPGARGAFSEEYKRLDEDLAAYCRRDVRVLVLDDTNHERERLEQLFELADQYQYQVVLVEPKTAWRLDCAQLKEKNQWQLSADDLKKLKPGLEKDFLPLYFGWFLTKKSSEALRKTGQTFLEELGNHKAFKKELRHCRWRGGWVGHSTL